MVECWSCRIVELSNGGVFELSNGGVVESSNGGWWNGGMVELSNRRIVEWNRGLDLILCNGVHHPDPDQSEMPHVIYSLFEI